MKAISRFLFAFAMGCQLVACSPSEPSAHAPMSLTSAQINSDLQANMMFRRMSDLRWRARGEVLKALTVDHQRLVAELLGQLSVASQPDVVAAARSLDRAINPKEKVSILAASAALRLRYNSTLQKLLHTTLQPGVADMFVSLSTKTTHEDPGMTVLLLLAETLSFRASMAAHGMAAQRLLRP